MISRKLPVRRCGFTLIELLVVLTIIAILVALLVPALGRARMQAEVTACMVNQRSTGMALHAYAADYREFPLAFKPVYPDPPDRREGEPYGFGQWTYRGDGHYWLKLLAGGFPEAPEYSIGGEPGGRYTTPGQLRCTGIGGRNPYYWSDRHTIDVGYKGDGHYDYGGPLIGAKQKWITSGPYSGLQELDMEALDNPQTEWPSDYGWQVNGNLLRDYNVRFRTSGVRLLAVCPTAFRALAGWWQLEPHGPSMLQWTPDRRAFNSYWRNGLFSDGHVETRYRPERYLGTGDGASNLRTSPWMPGGEPARGFTTKVPPS